MEKLLEHSEFRQQALQRDNNSCVICGVKADEVHHIMNRNLWVNGGYYLDNAATLCSEHHWQAEKSDITPEELRKATKSSLILPEGFSYKENYDSWGNTILPNGMLSYGPLRNHEGMLKILSHKTFTNKVKYPSTSYLPNSPTIDENDHVIAPECFENKRIVATEKMDGENTTMSKDYIHARSLDSVDHPSRSWVKRKWSEIRYDIPEGWRITGENVYAYHSILYTNLETYFYGFSIWTDTNTCLNWDDTLEWFELLNITPAPILYEGQYDLNKIHRKYVELNNVQESEGYVIRLHKEFSYKSFASSLAKWVRPNHIQTELNHMGQDVHWMHKHNIEPNKLKTI